MNVCSTNARGYLVKGRDLCKSLDPSRLISGANCMDSKVAKAVFDECGFDFYTQHPYSYEPKVLVDAMSILQGKPLVFTEGGGWYIHNNPNLLKWFSGTLIRSAHARPPEPCIAGLCWWQWQDIFQFSRGAGAPVTLAGDCRAVDIEIGLAASALHILGHTTYFPCADRPAQ